MTDKRKDCPMRHENGNCTVAGGFCTAVNDPICEALHNAFNCGYRSALRQQDATDKDVGKNDPLTLDDAIAHLDDTLSDTGRKWSCESCRMEHVQLRAWLAELRYIKRKRNAQLTLDELRQMEGQPVYIVENTEYWAIVNSFDQAGVYLLSYGNPDDYGYFGLYGKTWLAYRQKPEEGTV